MNKLFLLFLLSLPVIPLRAQNYIYTFSRGSQPYAELEGGRAVDVPLDWDDADLAVPLGFNFPLFGKPVDTLYSVGNGAANFSDIPLSEADEDELFNPRHLIFLDLEIEFTDRGVPDSVARSSITYHLIGSAPNRIGVLQYKNAGFRRDIYTDTVSDYFTNFQLWLYETSGIIETHYGPGTRESLPGDTIGPTAGLLVAGDYSYDEDTDLAEFTGMYYLNGNPAEPTFQDITVEAFNELSGNLEYSLDFLPAEGTVYRFEPSESSGLFGPPVAVGSFEAFPNPTTDRFTIKLPEALDGRVNRVELFDATGHRLRDLPSLPVAVDLSDLPVGMYHLRLTTDAGAALVGRVVRR